MTRLKNITKAKWQNSVTKVCTITHSVYHALTLPAALTNLPPKNKMSQHGTFPGGAPEATLANVLSSRFPIVRRLISRDLNQCDRTSLLLAAQGLNVSINSVDHFKPFEQYFPGGCDVMLPLPSDARPEKAIPERCAYGADFRDDEFKPCGHQSQPGDRYCEGRIVLKNQCRRAVCRLCAKRAYEIAHLGNYQNRVLNFGVTPICDSCADKVPGTPADVVDCGCIGPPAKGGEKEDKKLWLCLECRIAHNLERLKAADDMARAYLFMKASRDGMPEYRPGMKISHMKLPVCPCGNARYWTKCNFKRVRGMCVWCGSVKMPSIEGIQYSMLEHDIPYPELLFSLTAHMCSPLYDYIAKQHSPRESSIKHRVIAAEKLNALQQQIEQKGPPPSLSQGRNKFWSYTNITAEARVLDPNLRRDYEVKRREEAANRRKLAWDDREGYLKNFRWPLMEERRGEMSELQREVYRVYNEVIPGEYRTDYRWDTYVEVLGRYLYGPDIERRGLPSGLHMP